jgi:FkbM family methyltransferase
MQKLKRTLGFIIAHPIGKRHIYKSFFRLIIWQLQSSFYPTKLFKKRFLKPVKFYARKGLTGITGNIYTGLHEFYDMAFLLHFLQSGDVFFDIGANVGSYTLLASGVCKAKSIAIEPVRSTFEILTKNIKLNGLESRVSVINSAAGAERGMIAFTLNEDTTNHVAAGGESGAGVTTVPVIAIDSLSGESMPVLVKIDVEGFETEVLKGMTATLDMPLLKAIIIELNGSGARYGYSEDKIHHLLLSKGFKPHTYDPFNRLLSEIPVFGNNNTIYCRDLDFINQRLQIAAGINIMGEVI